MEDIEKLIIDNQPLVKSIAKKYTGRGIEFEDLVQHGTIGLWSALKKLDTTKGTLSTYATPYIENEINKAIGELTGLKEHTRKQINKMKKIENQLTQKLGREPKNDEIAAEMEVSAVIIRKLKKQDEKETSLDGSIADLVADNSITPEEQLVQAEDEINKDKIIKCFKDTLHPYERSVYFLRTEQGVNLTETAKALEVNRNRIVTIEKSIKEKYHKFFNSKEYEKLLNDKVDIILNKILEKHKKKIDASAKGEKFAVYEKYEKLLSIDFKDFLKRFDDEYTSATKFLTFGEYFKDLCDKKKVTYAKFRRATGLSESQFSVYKSSKPSVSIEAIVAFGIYFKIGVHSINTLLELGGFRFKINDRTHIAYTFILEELKGYPLEYCNKVLELLGIDEDDWLK